MQVLGVNPDVAWSKLPEATKNAVLFGQEGHSSKKKRGAAYDGPPASEADCHAAPTTREFGAGHGRAP